MKEYKLHLVMVISQIKELLYTYVFATIGYLIVILVKIPFNIDYYIYFWVFITFVFFIILLHYVIMGFGIKVNIINEEIKILKKEEVLFHGPLNTIKCEVFLSAPNYDKRSNWLPWDNFYHSELDIGDEKRIKIPFLLLNKKTILEIFIEAKITKRMNPFF